MQSGTNLYQQNLFMICTSRRSWSAGRLETRAQWGVADLGEDLSTMTAEGRPTSQKMSSSSVGGLGTKDQGAGKGLGGSEWITVSYTHLTLPTICSV
eukprot:497378-Rhodomonas_salina.2